MVLYNYMEKKPTHLRELLNAYNFTLINTKWLIEVEISIDIYRSFIYNCGNNFSFKIVRNSLHSSVQYTNIV